MAAYLCQASVQIGRSSLQTHGNSASFFHTLRSGVPITASAAVCPCSVLAEGPSSSRVSVLGEGQAPVTLGLSWRMDELWDDSREPPAREYVHCCQQFLGDADKGHPAP